MAAKPPSLLDVTTVMPHIAVAFSLTNCSVSASEIILRRVPAKKHIDVWQFGIILMFKVALLLLEVQSLKKGGNFMLKINIKEKGFTIVELLIVIVVIGILAALVLNTFSGVQKRARDTQRQTDINSLATQLEVYYNDVGAYPQFAQIDTVPEIQAILKGIDAGAVSAPNSTVTPPATDLQSSVALVTIFNKYGYQAFTNVAKTTACAANDACLNFTLSWTKEDGTPAVQFKNSLN